MALPVQVMHLDIKPQNVLLDSELHVKLVDFGLAAAFTPERPFIILPHLGRGTRPYTAPEMLVSLPTPPAACAPPPPRHSDTSLTARRCSGASEQPLPIFIVCAQYGMLPGRARMARRPSPPASCMSRPYQLAQAHEPHPGPPLRTDITRQHHSALFGAACRGMRAQNSIRPGIPHTYPCQ